jgi:hypothetical protein
MDLVGLRTAVNQSRIRWRAHALERMLERAISTRDVAHVLLSGNLVEDYADDEPFPSALLMASVAGRPLHVVVAFDSAEGYAYVVTAYEPDTDHFEPDLRTRQSHE